MKVHLVLAGLLMLSANATNASAPPDPAAAEAQLRAINHRFVNAFAVEDAQFMEELTDDDFVLTESNGKWLDRAEFLESMRHVKPGLRVSYDDVQVRMLGSIALIHGLFQGVGEKGVLRVRYTDAYRWDGERWRLVNAQDTALKAGVSPAVRTATKPVTTAWRGTDRGGDDHDVLKDLNENYVRAFREADVDWYDAHLTRDYVVINSDGSMDDRAAGLAAFSRPVFAEHMRSFPVDKVRIRRFDDVAFIHAENAFEFKDGRKGINRYTDVWQRQARGEWRCVAAHITTFKAPALD